MFNNRIRLPFYVSRAQFPTERSVFRRADGSTKVMSVIVRNTYEGITDYMPESFHRKLVIALSHDEVTIENDRYIGGVSIDGDYGINWQEFLDYPVAQGTFTVQVTPFSATNSNCVSCAQVQQISLVDDTYPTALGDGDAGEINVYDNDSICCYPATGELVYTNSSFITDAALSVDGVLSFTAVTPAPNQSGVKIATYRVTCEDGSYDEADVFASFAGSGEEGCCQPYGLSVDEEFRTIYFSADCNPDINFPYDFRSTANPGVVIASGGVFRVSRDVLIPSLVYLYPGEYIFNIYSNCGTSQSPTTTLIFTIPPPVGSCYEFEALYSAIDGPSEANISFINCAGDMINTAISRFNPTRVCLLVDESNNPVYAVSNRPSTTFTPYGECGSQCEIWYNGSGENAVNISYTACDGTEVSGVDITPGSNFCARFDTLSGEGIGLLSMVGPC